MNGYRIETAPEFIAVDNPEAAYYAMLSGLVTRHLCDSARLDVDVPILEFSLRRPTGSAFKVDVEPLALLGDPGLLLRYRAGDKNCYILLMQRRQGWCFSSLQLVYGDEALPIDDPRSEKVETAMDNLTAELGELQRRVFRVQAFHLPQD